MKQLRNKKAGLWMMMGGSFAIAFLAICPYLCAHPQVEAVAAHDCCPQSEQPSQQNKNNESGHCCDQHSPAIFKDTSSSFAPLADFQDFLVSFPLAPLSFFEKSNLFHFADGPPISSTKRPLYILKTSFLI